MACSSCQRRKKLLLAKLAAKKAKGKTVQAAAISAVLAVTEAVGQAVNISGQAAHMPRLPESGSDRLVGKLIGEQDEGTQEAPPVSDPKQPD